MCWDFVSKLGAAVTRWQDQLVTSSCWLTCGTAGPCAEHLLLLALFVTSALLCHPLLLQSNLWLGVLWCCVRKGSILLFALILNFCPQNWDKDLCYREFSELHLRIRDVFTTWFHSLNGGMFNSRIVMACSIQLVTCVSGAAFGFWRHAAWLGIREVMPQCEE